MDPGIPPRSTAPAQAARIRRGAASWWGAGCQLLKGYVTRITLKPVTLQALSNRIEKGGLCRGKLERILHARVPILKFRSGGAAIDKYKYYCITALRHALGHTLRHTVCCWLPLVPRRRPQTPHLPACLSREAQTGLECDVSIASGGALFKSTVMGLLAQVGSTKSGWSFHS